MTYEFTHEDLQNAVMTVQRHTPVLPNIGFNEDGELHLILRVTSEFARSDLWVELSSAMFPLHLVPDAEGEESLCTLYIGGKAHNDESAISKMPIQAAQADTWPSDTFCERSDQIHDERGDR